MTPIPDPLAFLRSYPNTLFVLHPEKPLPEEPLTERMLEALAEPELMSRAEVVVDVICEWMALHQTHSFYICPAAGEVYDRDLECSFAEVIEKFTALRQYCLSEDRLSFTITITTQGRDLQIHLSRMDDGISHACDADPWGRGLYVEGDWLNTGESLARNCQVVATEIARVADHLKVFAGIASFQAWCQECGVPD